MKVRVTGVDGRDGLAGLAADFDEAARVAPEEVRKVIQKGALNIKKDWARRWSGHPKIRMLPSAITYDTVQRGYHSEAEIGPDRARSGAALANLIEYEFGGIHSAPIPGGAPALESERPRLEKSLENLAAIDALDRRR